MKATPKHSRLKTAPLNRVILLPPTHVKQMASFTYIQSRCENLHLTERLLGQIYCHDNAVYDTSLGPCEVGKTDFKSSVAS